MMNWIVTTRVTAVVLVWVLVLTAGIAESQSSFYNRSQNRPPLPSPIGYVSDHAQVVEPEWKDRIRSVCIDLEKKNSTLSERRLIWFKSRRG